MHQCVECLAQFDVPEYLPPEYHMGPDFYVCPGCGADVTNLMTREDKYDARCIAISRSQGNRHINTKD